MKSQSIAKNFIFQFAYQAIILVVPLLMSPYLTRTLHESALGIYTYTNSIAYYFVILSMLGISRHGQRVIAQTSDNEKNLRKTFWSLYFVHFVLSIIVTIIYILFVYFFAKENKVIFYIQSLYVISAIFDITWLFYGLENFQSVVIKNTIVKVVESLLIILCVRSPSDLWKYTLISATGIMLGQIVMLPQAIKIIKPIKFTKKDAMQHIKPLLIFSISVIASALYTVFDKTLLGILSTNENVAFYEYSNNIVRVPRTVIGVIGTVLFPRACKLAHLGDIDGQKKYISYSFDITSFIGIATIFGLLSISDLFSLIYYGDSFKTCGGIMKALSPLAYIIGTGEIIRTQFMIPNHMDAQFNLSIVLNAVVNIVLSLILIPIIGVYGAVVGTLSAEIFGVVFQMYLCREYIHPKVLVRSTIPFIIIGLIMYLGKIFVFTSESSTFVCLVLEVALCSGIYCSLSLVYLFLFKKEEFNIIFGRFFKLFKR